MHVELLALTRRNPALTPAMLAPYGDLAAIFAGKSTYAEAIMEFAGRVCYRSTQRMGAAPDFIAARVREGHEDIIEHVVVTVRIRNSMEPIRWRMVNRHCEVSDLGDGEWIVSGNARVWLDFFRRGVALEALPILRAAAPSVFSEFEGNENGAFENGAEAVEPSYARPSSNGWAPIPDMSALLPVQLGPMRVTLLGFTQPLFDDPELALDHGSATFFFEGISRACTHQLVRHRLASFSQESQRYVELSKGGWKAIVPPAVAENKAAMAELAEFWRIAEEKYARLRELGILKEDARFLLPNAAETRIVATMNFAAWSHFLWLRAVDKAAQWEIRALGQEVLKMLHTIAPAVFAEHWRVYQEQFA
ncbi:MAG: FAD-dependent thymidylate synthase [Caldilinea sp.]|nr:FAD-dependent thymidylate synthase [Caldilinea sp.]MDW8440889.1 FAD-dependent thymidylate synthase [Caldilineaceae bacterium]